SFRTKDPTSWFVLHVEENGLERLPGAEEYAYLLIRPEPPSPPNIFWVSRPHEHFAGPRYVTLRPQIVLSNGQLVPKRVDGFVVYAAILHEAPHWPPMERLHVLRLDPHFATGDTFEIGFFGISRYLPPENRSTEGNP